MTKYAQLELTRRSFLKTMGIGIAGMGVFPLAGCGGTSSASPTWRIASNVYTTAQQQILPVALPASAPQLSLSQVSSYAGAGYSDWQAGPGLPSIKRTDLAPGYAEAPNVSRLLSFFTISDAHISDKESPCQPIYIASCVPYGPAGAALVSAYSPCILSTTHVLDAAVQTINALHMVTPFDFGIALGDDTNNTQYNELRWFIDVMDGKLIMPSSGGHAGASSIDYQMPYQAAGLNPEIPWYQVIGNHDQFWMGALFEEAKTLQAHVGNTILDMGQSPIPTPAELEATGYYMGVVDGTTPYGNIIGAGPEANFATPPTVVPDSDRHSLVTSSSTTLNWMQEFFNTTSWPQGHGFTSANIENDSACYSFVPKANLPLKVIVLDDTVKGEGQTNYATAALDQTRLTWLENELQAGQAANQLMIIAAHIPIAPQYSFANTTPFPLFLFNSSVNDSQLLQILHGYPNLILWIAGHRHVNVVTPQVAGNGDPTCSFWEVETSSLKDFPQQFRTFDIRRNSDNTISILVTNVDPAVAAGSPAAKSRGYAIGAANTFGSAIITDTSSHAYNAELVLQLTPAMQSVLANAGSAL